MLPGATLHVEEARFTVQSRSLTDKCLGMQGRMFVSPEYADWMSSSRSHACFDQSGPGQGLRLCSAIPGCVHAAGVQQHDSDCARSEYKRRVCERDCRWKTDVVRRWLPIPYWFSFVPEPAARTGELMDHLGSSLAGIDHQDIVHRGHRVSLTPCQVHAHAHPASLIKPLISHIDLSIGNPRCHGRQRCRDQTKQPPSSTPSTAPCKKSHTAK